MSLPPDPHDDDLTQAPGGGPAGAVPPPPPPPPLPDIAPLAEAAAALGRDLGPTRPGAPGPADQAGPPGPAPAAEDSPAAVVAVTLAVGGEERTRDIPMERLEGEWKVAIPAR